ncbi:CFEM domain-containing protein [Paramyrothecium foliicola]|nr:CFEM domain-containing protein [Paramyrothecium foliicola]
MLPRLTALFLGLSVLMTAVRGDTESSLASYPECARPCIIGAFSDGLCAPSNQSCICTSPTFQQTVTLCVSANCTIPDALQTRNASLTNCGAPVRDRAQELVTVTHTLLVLSAVFVILRFGYKLLIARIDLGLDDWFVLTTLIFTIPSAVITTYGTTPNGLGKDIWTLDPHMITNVVRFFYMMAWLYFSQAMLVKLSIICFYMRIFPSKEVQRVLWGTFAFTSVWGLVFVLTAIFQCRPINYFWKKWDGMHEGTCADANAISWSHAAMSIALDIWILLIPLWQLRKLHLHWKKKIPVAFMFGVGTFVTVVSILRLQSLLTFGASSNSTWEFYDVSLWSTIEICVGIMCACLPTIRMLLVKIFPALSGSYASRGAYYNQASGPRSGFTASGRHDVRIASVKRKDSDEDESPTGIRFQKSYVVQFSDRDNDESSLVQMSDLQPPAKAWQPDP